MKKIVAVNCSPRTEWNTGTLIRQAAGGAEAAGAETQIFDLYRMDKFMWAKQRRLSPATPFR